MCNCKAVGSRKLKGSPRLLAGADQESHGDAKKHPCRRRPQIGRGGARDVRALRAMPCTPACAQAFTGGSPWSGHTRRGSD